MPQVPDFPAMDVGEIVVGAIDFGNWLDSDQNEIISGITAVTSSNYYPALSGDPAYVSLNAGPQVGTVSTADGGSGIANGAVLQKWTAAAAGVARIQATVTTSLGQTLIGWAHQVVGVPA